MKRRVIIIGAVTLCCAALLPFVRAKLQPIWFSPTQSTLPVFQETLTEPKVIYESLYVPWELARLPDDSFLVTQRSGEVLHLQGSNRIQIPIERAVEYGEGGLLGLTVHPNFTENKFVYLYMTEQTTEGYKNRIERFRFDVGQLVDPVVIIENINGAAYHDGGRIAFGPDSKLYVGTGDAGIPDDAQNILSLSGKILRLNDDGSIPNDNPFNNAVYSYGHRNVQGFAWDSDGGLWASEHGPSGKDSGEDEINKIVSGGNFGWPVVTGDETTKGMISPAVHSGKNETWAPGGVAIVGRTLYFAGLRGESLYTAKIDGDLVHDLQAHYHEVYGRIRTVVADKDTALYILTSNRDGRGYPRPGDDKIILVPQLD